MPISHGPGRPRGPTNPYVMEHHQLPPTVDRHKPLRFDDAQVAFRGKGLKLFRVNNAESLASYGVQLPGEQRPRGFKNLWTSTIPS